MQKMCFYHIHSPLFYWIPLKATPYLQLSPNFFLFLLFLSFLPSLLSSFLCNLPGPICVAHVLKGVESSCLKLLFCSKPWLLNLSGCSSTVVSELLGDLGDMDTPFVAKHPKCTNPLYFGQLWVSTNLQSSPWRNNLWWELNWSIDINLERNQYLSKIIVSLPMDPLLWITG